MILQCPECETRFLVDSSLIPHGGRTVKCAKCAHMWHVEPEEDPRYFVPDADDPAALPQDEEPQDEPRFEPRLEFDAGPDEARVERDYTPDYDIPFSPQLPSLSEQAKRNNRMMMVAAIALLLMLSVSALFTFREQLQGPLAGLYDLLGMPSSEGLVLAEVTFRERPTRNKARYIVEGKIVNESSEERRVPLLRVAVADKDGNWIISREYEADARLQPGEAYPFKAANLETTFVDRVDHLVVEIGNGVELMLRQ